jgi:hypothetical protein
MAETFAASLTVKGGWTWKAATGWPQDVDNIEYSKSWADGYSTNQGEAKWTTEDATLLNGNSTTLDLTNMTRTFFGDTLAVTFLTIRAILVINKSTTGGQLIVGGAASNEWHECFGAAGDQQTVPLDGVWASSNPRCGWEVDDNNKNLKIAASGGNVTYSMLIIGTTTTAVGDCSSSGL